MQTRETRRVEFERVALPHLDRMYRYALGMTRDADEARDAVQEAYFRAWKYFGTYQPGAGGARAWLYRILYHAFLARRKRGVREAPWPEDEAASDTLLYDRLVREGGWPDPLPSHGRNLAAALGDEVRAAVGRLPAAYRFPLLLCDLEGLPYADIARVVGCPVNTVRSRIARARRRLQSELAVYARNNGYLRRRRSR